MYTIIRVIIGCVFLVCSIITIKKSKAIRKHILYITFTGLSVVLIVVLTFCPFENLFITFDSPQAAYAYCNWGKSNIELIIEGDDCDFIIDRKNDSDTYWIIPKTADGWKIGSGANTKRIGQTLSNGIVVYVYQYKDISDYFITILDTNGGESTVSDEYNTEFFLLERYNDSLGETFVTYYAHIADFHPQYSVRVNDNKIVLGNQ